MTIAPSRTTSSFRRSLSNTTPYAIFAWEFLRRNAEYRRAAMDDLADQAVVTRLSDGAILLRSQRRNRRAEEFGLLQFCDPRLEGQAAPVFWQPEVLTRSVPISLFTEEAGGENRGDKINLSQLEARKHILDHVDGRRYINLSGEDLHLQLHALDQQRLSNRLLIGLNITDFSHGARVLDSAKQLLSLHNVRHTGRQLRGKCKDADRLSKLLRILDLHLLGYSYKRIAIEVYGSDKVSNAWISSNCLMKDRIRRQTKAALSMSQSGYRKLLAKKSL